MADFSAKRDDDGVVVEHVDGHRIRFMWVRHDHGWVFQPEGPPVWQQERMPLNPNDFYDAARAIALQEAGPPPSV